MEIKNQHEEIVLGKLRWQGQDGPIRFNVTQEQAEKVRQAVALGEATAHRLFDIFRSTYHQH